MNLLNILSAGELYRIAGYSNKLHNENPDVSESGNEADQFAKGAAGYQAVFNWACMRYITISSSVKKILGYDASLFINRGFNFSLSIIHPSDLDLLREIHQAIFSYYYGTPT
ncbi:MAG: hypothetical protein EOP55_09360, partial [Sphingobacteriales bacterium]